MSSGSGLRSSSLSSVGASSGESCRFAPAQDPAERDAAALDQQGPFHAGLAAGQRGSAGAFPAAGRLRDAAVDRELLQGQADDPVIGLAGDLLQLREDPGPDPLAAALADRGGPQEQSAIDSYEQPNRRT